MGGAGKAGHGYVVVCAAYGVIKNEADVEEAKEPSVGRGSGTVE